MRPLSISPLVVVLLSCALLTACGKAGGVRGTVTPTLPAPAVKVSRTDSPEVPSATIAVKPTVAPRSPTPATALGTATGVTSYAALAGKSITSPEVASLLHSNQCSISGSHYLCYSAGIELSFDSNNRVILVVLNRTRGDWKQYQGPLPEGISWNDTRDAVERKLGAPTASYDGVSGIRAWAQYARGAVVVTFDVPNGAAGANAVIYDIRVK